MVILYLIMELKMKTKIFYFFIAVILSNISIFAQESNIDDFNYETEDVKTEAQGYFSIGAAYTATLNFVNFDDVNLINKKFGFEDFKTPLLANGFEIKTGTVLFKNFNIGFFSNSGIAQKIADTTLSSINYKRINSYSIENLGFLFEYSIVPVKSLAISPGLQIGFGKIGIEYSQSPSMVNYQELPIKSAENSYFNVFEKSFLNIEPKLSIEYAVTTFLMFRVTASYNISIDNPVSGGNWTYNGASEVNNLPEKINMQNFNLQLGLFIGLMNF